MRIKNYLVPLLAGTILLSACQKNTIKLSYTNAKGEVPQLGNLIFRFNKSLIKDSLLNMWDSTEYVSFDPKIPGRFRWESPDQLVFSPSQPLNPATTYEVKIRNAVLKYSKYDAVSGGEKLSFHTPPLTLENTQVTWVGESGGSALPQVELFFNYRVNPADLKEKLNIEVAGKKVDYTAVIQSADNNIPVRINGLKQEDRDLEAKVIIEKGLKPQLGGNATIGRAHV